MNNIVIDDYNFEVAQLFMYSVLKYYKMISSRKWRPVSSGKTYYDSILWSICLRSSLLNVCNVSPTIRSVVMFTPPRHGKADIKSWKLVLAMKKSSVQEHQRCSSYDQNLYMELSHSALPAFHINDPEVLRRKVAERIFRLFTKWARWTKAAIMWTEKPICNRPFI